MVLNYYKNYIKSIGFNLNTSKAYLDQYFKDNHIELDVIHKYMIFDIFSDGKRKYSKNKELLQKTVDGINKFYDKINKEEKLRIYEKIKLYFECMDIESLNKIDIEYYILSECEENSIIDKSKKFFHDFVSKINEESKIFPYLLNIDSGIGYYKGETVYTFDMTYLETIKNHLEELFPNILVFYYLEDISAANINKNTSFIAINKYIYFMLIQMKIIFLINLWKIMKIKQMIWQ